MWDVVWYGSVWYWVAIIVCMHVSDNYYKNFCNSVDVLITVLQVVVVYIYERSWCNTCLNPFEWRYLMYDKWSEGTNGVYWWYLSIDDVFLLQYNCKPLAEVASFLSSCWWAFLSSSSLQESENSWWHIAQYAVNHKLCIYCKLYSSLIGGVSGVL